MSISAIRSALVKGLIEGSFFDVDKIAFENQKFDIPSEPWAKFSFLPNQPNVATLGPSGSDNIPGIAQVDVNYPLDSGDKEAGLKADAIRNSFKAGARFSYSDQVVIIRSSGRSAGRVIDGYWRVSVTISFYARITR